MTPFIVKKHPNRRVLVAGANAMLQPCLEAAGDAAVAHLVMCPFAGGSKGAFRSWCELDDLGVNVSLAVYPGRDFRRREPCEERIDRLADQLTHELSRTLGAELTTRQRPLLLAGHSMGAQVAFETCARLERAGTPPDGLVLSACRAPHLRGRRALSHLDDPAFIAQLIDMGGCAPELLANPSLLPLFLPLLRADFRATEAYHRKPTPDRQRLRTPTLLLYGRDDREASRDDVHAWQTWLHNATTPVALAGDHFNVTRKARVFLGRVMRHFGLTSPPFIS